MRITGWLVLLLCLYISSALYAVSGDLGAGKGADGSEAMPWLIEDFADFEAFCGDASKWVEGVYTRLEADIDLDPALPGREIYTQAPIAGDEDETNYSTFDGTRYSGNFNGNGKTISNLTVNGASYCGLFGRTESGSVITDLGVEDVSITCSGSFVGGLVGDSNSGSVSNCYSSGAVTGGHFVGGLVGYIEFGSVSNCYSSGTVSGGERVGGLVGDNFYGSVSNCYSSGAVTGGHFVGGLVGDNYRGNVSNCYSSGNVTGYDSVGGLVGDNYRGNVSNCYSSGNVTGDVSVGGLVGRDWEGIVSNCYSSGDVSGDYSVGGLVGYNYRGSVSNCYSSGTVTGYRQVGGLVGYNSYGSVINCYSSGAVAGDYSVGGLVGDNFYGSVSNCFWDVETSGIGTAGDNNYGAIGKTTAEMQDINTFINVGWDFVNEAANGTSEIWQMPESGGYPIQSSFNDYVPVLLDGEGSRSYPYLISNAMELGAVCHYDSSAYYKLTADIELSGIQWSTAIIPLFDGHFDGDGHIINNLTISGGGYLGMFGKIAGSAEICDVGLENISITGSGSYVGGLVGYIESGSISNCYSSGDVTGSGDRVGGLVGDNFYGSVSNCYSSGDVTGSGDNVGGLVGDNSYGSVSNCYSSGDVTGDMYVGGLMGRDWEGSVSNCYSSGDVTGSGDNVGGLVGDNSYGSVSNCYSSGDVTGDMYVGGLMGRDWEGSVSNCYSSGTVTCSGSYVGGLVGDNSYGIVSNCYSSGDVTGDMYVGGLVGENINGSVSNCYSSGDVTGYSGVGGLMGVNDSGSVSNCYSSGDVAGGGYVGGLVGWNENGSVSNCFWDVETSGIGTAEDNNYGAIGKTTAEMQDINTFINVGWDFVNEAANGTSEIWQMPESGGYPIQSSFNDYVPVLLDGEGSQSYPYLISNAIELGAVCHYDSSAYYKLTADIELSGIQWSTAAIPIFNGNFDGGGHIINNLTMSGGEYLGMFGKIAGSAEICDIGLENISITGSGRYVGGLVGDSFSGSVSNCYSSGDVTGGYFVGGLVGYNFYGSVSNCYSSGTVSGGERVGGLVGDSYYDSVSNCYSSGDVTGGYFVGGLVGDSNSGSVSNCFWDIETSGIADPEAGLEDTDGTIGKTTAEMQDVGTFLGAGWDFVGEDGNDSEDLWRMPYEMPGYPILAWEKDIAGDIAGGYGVDMTDAALLASGWMEEYGLADLEELAVNWLNK